MNIPDIFGQNVFSDEIMHNMLPKYVYDSIKKTVEKGTVLDSKSAKIIANAMKDWAIQKGATHYTHWFQPMTGTTAEKHDSFISSVGGGKVVMEFSGRELIKGEPDASSFPSGGIRSTFEARGYTAWDATSPAFVKDDTLYIPTAFCSYTGEALDKKTPLLKSMEALNKQALRILKLFGNVDAERVFPTVGAEQEYFLIDKELYNKRKDLIFTGRTLFGCKPLKGQELDDHYFGAIKPRIAAYMKELDIELWKLGVLAKTKHNETAPCQHELAPLFTTANLATDHNQITMELMKKIADKHNLVCLLHEKPFAGVNGNGKHNNWSMSTDTGINLLEPGASPSENAQFILFLCAVLKAVDEYQDLLRLSVASAGNDHRLGSNEAPPAIISMYLGEELTDIITSVENGSKYKVKDKVLMKLGVDSLPELRKDTTDRNRTSPFAFTGNKFEFRMVGSALSIAEPNIILNTIVAESLRQFADALETSEDFNKDVSALVVSTIKKHKRIIFNGNNYSEEWIAEAEKRGLLNLHTTADALPLFNSKKNVELFTRHCVFSKIEIASRTEILLDGYCKSLNIEALTMIDMAKKEIFPAVSGYVYQLAKAVSAKKNIGVSIIESEIRLIAKLSDCNEKMYKSADELESALPNIKHFKDIFESGNYYKNTVLPLMKKLREYADEMEPITADSHWPFPTYSSLLSRI